MNAFQLTLFSLGGDLYKSCDPTLWVTKVKRVRCARVAIGTWLCLQTRQLMSETNERTTD